jgi:hypothetical protein
MPEPVSLPVGQVFNTVTIKGRLEESRFHEGTTYSVIAIPAPDEYSHPQRVEVGSKQPLGAKGADVQVGCRLAGSGRKFEYADKTTGAIQRGTEYRVRLFALDQ